MPSSREGGRGRGTREGRGGRTTGTGTGEAAGSEEEERSPIRTSSRGEVEDLGEKNIIGTSVLDVHKFSFGKKITMAKFTEIVKKDRSFTICNFVAKLEGEVFIFSKKNYFLYPLQAPPSPGQGEGGGREADLGGRRRRRSGSEVRTQRGRRRRESLEFVRRGR